MAIQKVTRPQYLVSPQSGPFANKSKFTELADGPGAIEPGKTLVGNADGTALEFKSGADDPPVLEHVSFPQKDSYIGGVDNNAVYADNEVIIGKAGAPSTAYNMRSFDRAESWENYLPSPATIVPIGRLDTGALVGATSSKLFYYSDDNGKTWTSPSPIVSNSSTCTAGVSEDTALLLDYYLYSGVRNYRIYRARNQGAAEIVLEVKLSKGNKQAHPMIVCEGTVAFYLTQEDKFYRSTDYGETWESFARVDVLPFADPISSIAFTIDAMNQKRMLCLCNKTHIYESVDACATWTLLCDISSVFDQNETSLRVLRTIRVSGPVIVGFSGNDVAINNFYTLNNGVDWTPFAFQIKAVTNNLRTGRFVGNTLYTYSESTSFVNMFGVERLTFNTPMKPTPPMDSKVYGVQNNIWVPLNVPPVIEPGKVLVGNADGTGFEWKSITELT